MSRKNNCQSINQKTDYKGNKERVAEINKAEPDCNCENYSMSKFSPNVVDNNETLARFIFSPMHLGKKGEIKPAIFSHVHDRGCSIQRDSIATSEELIEFAKDFLNADEKHSWEGVLLAECSKVREIKCGNVDNRAVCIYDTANKNNPAHGEMAQSQYIEEADKIELRHDLFQAFNNNNPILPEKYREGKIFEQLPHNLKRSTKLKRDRMG